MVPAPTRDLSQTRGLAPTRALNLKRVLAPSGVLDLKGAAVPNEADPNSFVVHQGQQPCAGRQDILRDLLVPP